MNNEAKEKKKEKNKLQQQRLQFNFNVLIVFSPYNWVVCNQASDSAAALGCPFCLTFMFSIGLVLQSIPFSPSEGWARAMLHCFLLNYPLLMQDGPSMGWAGSALVQHKLLHGLIKAEGLTLLVAPGWGWHPHTPLCTLRGYVWSLHTCEIHK